MGRNSTVACLGPAASFSHFAARQVFGETAEYRFMTQYLACQAVLEGSAKYAVIPVENNVGGFVEASLDALYWHSRLTIVDQIYLPIAYNLLSHAKAVEDIEVIYSHAQAFAQCRRHLDELAAQRGRLFERIDVSSTTKGVLKAKQEVRAAALASLEASEVYGLPVLAGSLQDYPDNTTRFYLIHLGNLPQPTGNDRSAFLFEVTNEPGALVNILNLFAKNKINLLSLATRPRHQAPGFDWNYAFFLECGGHFHQEPLDGVYRYFQEMRLPSQERKLRLLGSFPARNSGETRYFPVINGPAKSNRP
jgi:prephenate dehydratase